jgi:hypothetical protein
MTAQKEFLEDLQFAYSKVLIAMFTHLTHYDDGGCDYDQVGYKKTFIYNSVLVIYQPIDPSNGWIEDGCILMMPTKESGIKITQAIATKSRELFNEVETKFIDSYNGFVSKYGHWIEQIQGSKTFQKITGILQPIHFDGKIFKMKWHIKALWEGPTYRWNPKELINWMNTLSSCKKYRTMKTNESIEKIEEAMEEAQKKVDEYLLKMGELCKIQKFVDVKDEKVKLAKAINELEEDIGNFSKHIREMQESLEVPEMEKEYIDDEEERLPAWYIEKSEHHCDKQTMIAKVVSYNEAFPERASLSGKKRKL